MTADKAEGGNNCKSNDTMLSLHLQCTNNLLLGLTPFSDGNEAVSVSNLIATGIIPRPHKLLA